MAFAWIKIEDSTPDKPEVWKMAEKLGIDADAVLGKLVRVWIWADQQTIDGNAHSVTKALLDRTASVAGFADAMITVGWLRTVEDGVQFHNFDRHNGETAKKRALTRRRVEKHRSGNADSVTDFENGNADSVIKRREEKKKHNKEKEKNAGGRSADVLLDEANDETPDVIIPPSVNIEPVRIAARKWFRYLTQTAPAQVPRSGSERLRAFWARAAELGPDRFIAAVDFSILREYHQLNEEWKDGQKRRTAKATTVEIPSPAERREANNAKAFAAVFGSCPANWTGSGDAMRLEAGRVYSPAATDLGDGLELLPAE